MKFLERSSTPPGTDASHDVLMAVTMAIALSLSGITAWMWTSR